MRRWLLASPNRGLSTPKGPSFLKYFIVLHVHCVAFRHAVGGQCPAGGGEWVAKASRTIVVLDSGRSSRRYRLIKEKLEPIVLGPVVTLYSATCSESWRRSRDGPQRPGWHPDTRGADASARHRTGVAGDGFRRQGIPPDSQRADPRQRGVAWLARLAAHRQDPTASSPLRTATEPAASPVWVFVLTSNGSDSSQKQ